MRTNTHIHFGPVMPGNAWSAWYFLSVVCVLDLVLKERLAITRDSSRHLFQLGLSCISSTQLYKTVSPFALWSQQGKEFMKQCLPQETRHWVTEHIQPEVPVKITYLLASEILPVFTPVVISASACHRYLIWSYKGLSCAKRNSIVVQWTQRTVPNVTKTKEL